MPLLADDESAPAAAASSAMDTSMTETDLLDSVADKVLDETLGSGGAAASASAASAANDTTMSTFDKVWEQQSTSAAAAPSSVVSGTAADASAAVAPAAAETANDISNISNANDDVDDDTFSCDEEAVTEISGNTGRQNGTASVTSTPAASAVSAGAEITQEVALTEIQNGADGFDRIEEGRGNDEYAYGGADDDDDEPNKARKAPNEEAVANSFKKGGAGSGGRKRCGKTTIVLAVLGVIVAAAIAIGACVGAGVISFGGDSSNAKQASGGDPITLEPTPSPTMEDTDPPTVEVGKPTSSPVTRAPTTSRPTATPTRAPVMATRYEAGADFDVATALSDPEAVATPGTPQHEALKWLVDVDPMRLTTDATEAAVAGSGLKLVDSEKFLQRYALTTVIFALTDGEQSGDGMGLDIDEEGDVPEEEEMEEVASVPEPAQETMVVEEEEVEDILQQQPVDDKEAEKAAKEAEKAAKEAAKQKEKEDKEAETNQGPAQQANERFPEDDSTATEGTAWWQVPPPAGAGGGRRQRRRHRRTMAAELLPAGIDECDLKAIQCNREGKITKIKFRKMGLTGILSPEISQFWQTLTSLDLSENQIQGTIPDAIYDMYWLEGLYLKSNRFTGTISSKIGQLTSLVHFYAGENNLSGGVTLGFGGCKNLRNLSLYNNNLSGPIPDWPSLDGLFMLDLGRNKMTGTLTESLGNHRILRLLYLNNNRVSISGRKARAPKFCNVVFVTDGTTVDIFVLLTHLLNLSFQ